MTWKCLASEARPGLFVCLVGFLTSSSTTRLYRGRAPRQSVWQFYVLPHMRQTWETMTSVSAGHITLTPTQPVGCGRPQRESNPGPPHQETRALPTELPPPPPFPLGLVGSQIKFKMTILFVYSMIKCQHFFFTLHQCFQLKMSVTIISVTLRAYWKHPGHGRITLLNLRMWPVKFFWVKDGKFSCINHFFASVDSNQVLFFWCFPFCVWDIWGVH